MQTDSIFHKLRMGLTVPKVLQVELKSHPPDLKYLGLCNKIPLPYLNSFINALENNYV